MNYIKCLIIINMSRDIQASYEKTKTVADILPAGQQSSSVSPIPSLPRKRAHADTRDEVIQYISDKELAYLKKAMKYCKTAEQKRVVFMMLHDVSYDELIALKSIARLFIELDCLLELNNDPLPS